MYRRRRDPVLGFSLIEVLVTLAVASLMLVGLYQILESSNRVTKQQTLVADTQAGSRQGMYELARLVRQARVGQLYFGDAVLPYNNLDASGGDSLPSPFNDLTPAAHVARTGTDAIQIRGILFDQVYFFNSSDITGVPAALQVTLNAASTSGVTNFSLGSIPPLASKTSPFYFVVSTSEITPVAVGSNSYLTTLYYVGLVNPGDAMFKQSIIDAPTTGKFQFTMDCTAAGAKKYYPDSTGMTGTLQRPFAGGPLDDVIFYVDRGAPDPNVAPARYTHPYLAEAVLDANSGNYNIQPLVEEVEDLQIAYGVDGADGTAHDRGVDPSQTSINGDKDEWVYNVSDDTTSLKPVGNPPVVRAFVDSTIPTGLSIVAALRSVMIGIVAKTSEPEVGTAKMVGGAGYKLFDSRATSISDPSITGRTYRRRVQTFAVSLRNIP